MITIHLLKMETSSGAPTKKFWDSVKPFLSDKGVFSIITIYLLKMETSSGKREQQFLRFLMTST